MAVLTKITSRSLADNAVSSAKIQDGAIAVADVADGSITTAKLADDAVTTVKILNDNVTAAKIPAGAVVADVGTGGITATQLATDAVIAVKIQADAVTSSKIATGAVIADGIGAGAVVAAGIGAGAVTTVKIANDVLEVKPHIKHGWLYPAIKDAGGTVRLSDGVTAINASATGGPAGSTITASAYGTVQADGKMYYYTDIKGSKPIKDPRIGAHFGSQRHKFKSIQKLEQETATHGANVYSIDGREWCRVTDTSNALAATYGDFGHCLNTPNTGMTTVVEITGYFNDFNCSSRTRNIAVDDINVTVNGGTTRNSANTDKLGGRTTLNSPLRNRFVDAGSIINHGDSNVTSDLGTTPSINTIKIAPINTGSEYWQFFGIELIAQDTTSTTTKSQIQIQPQNVVSYGKRFTVGITQSATATDKKALHYNPFAFKTDGTTAWASGAHNGTGWPAGLNSAHNIDTATSLGLSKWLHSSNYYKPYNGGRVVVWVDSSGNIKTSVTVMPPNARSVNTGNISNKANASIANNTYLPTFETGAVNDFPTSSLAEVAKTFHTREFGNGGANHNATYKDYSSQANATQGLDTAYVMDDGLTGASGGAYFSMPQNDINWGAANDYIYFTFIGTGFSKDGNGGNTTFAQNLPYGTHIVKLNMNSSATWYSTITVDGVSLGTTLTANYYNFSEVSFHQPKMPPIPEDAVVIADYMLMADFVSIPDTTSSSKSHIPKGTVRVSCTRDFHYEGSAHTWSVAATADDPPDGIRFYNNSTSKAWTLPYFGSDISFRSGVNNDRATNANFKINGTLVTTSSSGTNHSGSQTLYSQRSGSAGFSTDNDGTFSQHANALGSGFVAVKGLIIGQNTLRIDDTSTSYLVNGGAEYHTGIHTSSHYQSFETPFLHELVGGSRNMEQNNLVVTPDGKTWDQVTRDVSYLGPRVALVTQADTSGNHSSEMVIFTQHRGGSTSGHNANKFAKGILYAYDRVIILEDGLYDIEFQTYSGALNVDVSLKYNDDTTGGARGNGQLVQLRIDPADETAQTRARVYCKRGDFFCIATNTIISKSASLLEIQKVE
jgi:hypothetical protein